MLAILLALLLGALAGAFGAPALAMLAPLFVAICAVWPAAGVAALITACALDRFAVSAGGPNVRPDELAALALAAALVLRTALTARIPAPPRGRRPVLESAWQGRTLKGQRHVDTMQTFQGPNPAPFLQGQATSSQAAPGWGVRVPDRGRYFVGGVSSEAAHLPTRGGGVEGEALHTSSSRDKPTFKRVRVPLLLPLLAYLGVNMLSTLTSADPARGLSLDLITLDLMVLYAVLALTLSTPARLLWGVRLWLGVAAVEAVAGMLAFAVYLTAHAAVPGVQLDIVSGAPLVYGTLYEGNIFGSYMSAAFLIALALVGEETARRRGMLYLVLAASAMGLLLSGTRSAWGATVIGALILLVLLRLGRGGRRGRLLVRLVGGLVAVSLVAGIGLAVLPASVTGAFGARAQGLLNFGSGSGYGRVQLYKVAVDEWQAHPLLGVGPGSFTYRLPGDYSTGPAWLPNLILQALHDTGVLGLLALLWLFTAFYVTTIGALRSAPPGESRAALAGLVAAVTALLIAFQLTPGFQLGYTWALLALGVAGSRAVTGAREGRAMGEETAAA